MEEPLGNDIDRLLEEARAAVSEDGWGTAREIARRVLELDPTNDDAEQLLIAGEFRSSQGVEPTMPVRKDLPADRLSSFGSDQGFLMDAISDLARLLHGLGNAVVAAADLLQVPLLASFDDSGTEARWFSSQAEEFVTGLKELQSVKKDVIKRIDLAKSTGKKVTIEIKDLLPPFVKSQIEMIFGKSFLEKILKLKPLVLDPATCEAESSGNAEETFELDLSDFYAYIGGLAGPLKKVVGLKLKVTIKATVRMKLDCEKLKNCSLEITKIKGIEFEGVPNLNDITVDTKGGKASVGLNWLPSFTILDLEDMLEKLAELVKKLKEDLEKITDETKRKEKQQVIAEFEKQLSDLKKEQEKLKQFPR